MYSPERNNAKELSITFSKFYTFLTHPEDQTSQDGTITNTIETDT